MLLRRHLLFASLFVRVCGRPGEAALLYWSEYGAQLRIFDVDSDPDNH